MMFILGLQGSPRKKGNTHDILSMFMEQARQYGAVTQTITPHTLDIKPCRELIVCEKKGFCPIKDDMEKSIYKLVKNADIIVIAAPVFFYNVPAQLKALIDRCQMFWGRKYKLKLEDPNAKNRQGVLLSCGASGGKKLFDGVELTAKIFFDAVSVKYQGSLTYRHIENPGDMAAHDQVKGDIQQMVKNLCSPFVSKKKILFISRNDACRSQMAAAFFKSYNQGHFRVMTAGYDPAKEIRAETIKIMAEKRLDLLYLSPCSIENLDMEQHFDTIIYIGEKSDESLLSALQVQTWKINTPEKLSLENIRALRDEIESRVKSLVLL
jgi:arsenate reductase